MRFLREAWNLLGSRRLATAVMVAWAALLLVWIIPFQFYGLPDSQIRAIVYGEPFFVALYIAFAATTLACILPRVGSSIKRARQGMLSLSSRPSDGGTALAIATDAEKVAAALRATGFRMRSSDSGGAVAGEPALVGSKNRLSPYGSLVFHLGLIALLFALALHFSLGLGFQGNLVLAEGEEYTGDPTLFVDVDDSLAGTPPILSFTVQDVNPRFHEDVLLFTALDATVLGPDDRSHDLSLAFPWFPSPTTFVSVQDFGYALEVNTSQSATAPTEISRPVTYKLKAFPSGQVDTFEVQVEGESYTVVIEVFGDYVDRDGTPGVASFNSDNPYLGLSVTQPLTGGGERVLAEDVLLPVGQSLDLGDASIAFPGLSHYAVFRVVDSPTLPWALLGFILVMAGTTWRLVFPRTDVLWVTDADGETSRLYARSDVYGDRPDVARRVLAKLGGKR